MRFREISVWIAYFILIIAAFFWLKGVTAHAEPVAIYLYCQKQETVEQIITVQKDQGHEAANHAAEAALHSGDCFATSDELPLYVVARGSSFRDNGSFIQVVGLSTNKKGEIAVWSIFFSADGST